MGADRRQGPACRRYQPRHDGKPGDAPTSLTGQPSACGTAREVGTLCHLLPGGRLVANSEHRKESERLWNLPEGRINPKTGHHTVLMFEKFCTPTAKGGDIGYQKAGSFRMKSLNESAFAMKKGQTSEIIRSALL